MDNRRVLRSFRERQEAARLPYARTEGLFAKVKLFLAPSTLWNPQNSAPPQDPSRPISSSPVLELAPRNRNVTSEGSSLRSILATPQRPTLASLDRPDSTPQQVLSSFFEAKGNEPLTDVEYAGVVSLLEKSRHNTPKWLSVRLSDLLAIHSVSETPKDQKNTHSNHRVNSGVSGVSTALESTDNVAELSSLTLFTTPYPQRVLKGDGSSFATPEYRPVYHTVAGTATRLSVPSVKRVYQFSGLPSPYRTRIRTPTVPSRRSRPQDADLSLFGYNNSTSAGVKPRDDSKIGHDLSKNGTIGHQNGDGKPPVNDGRPLSTAANKLLSILDDAQGSESRTGLLGQFLSPYEKPKKKRTALGEPAPQKKKMTALDISRTMDFDQMKELPKQNEKKDKDESSELLNKGDHVGTNGGRHSNSKNDSADTKIPVESSVFGRANGGKFTSKSGPEDDASQSNRELLGSETVKSGKSQGLFGFGTGNSSSASLSTPVVPAPSSTGGFLFGFTSKPSLASNPADNTDLFASKVPKSTSSSVKPIQNSLSEAPGSGQDAPNVSSVPSSTIEGSTSTFGGFSAPLGGSNAHPVPSFAGFGSKATEPSSVKTKASLVTSEPAISSGLALHITFPPIVPLLVPLDTDKVQRYKKFFQF